MKYPESKIPKIHNPKDRELDLKIWKKNHEKISKKSWAEKSLIHGNELDLKILKNLEWKPRNPGNRDWAMETSKKSEISRVEHLQNLAWSGYGFEYFEKNPEKIPSEKSRKLKNPRDRNLFLSLGILTPEIRDFSYFRNFYPKDCDFFVGLDIPTKSRLWSQWWTTDKINDDF